MNCSSDIQNLKSSPSKPEVFAQPIRSTSQSGRVRFAAFFLRKETAEFSLHNLIAPKYGHQACETDTDTWDAIFYNQMVEPGDADQIEEAIRSDLAVYPTLDVVYNTLEGTDQHLLFYFGFTWPSHLT